MDLNSLLLQANRSVTAGFRNMQYEVPLPVSMNHDMTSAPHYGTQNLYVPSANPRIKSENNSDRGVSPHNSEQSSRYSSNTPQNGLAYQQLANQLSNGMRYPSPSPLAQQNLLMQQYPPDQSYPQQSQMGPVAHPMQPQDQDIADGGRHSTGSAGLPKAFACSTCQKGFARRSDLARHERIHSGVRPHVCDHPGCGKQFIQRSALTVHTRVHTGEKPHMCERCGKPFSDSSSLARHRRIHSGKRPYKCPYADCQKTFTRRTTLTRHQNHHTGTIEESEAATAAALAGRVSAMAGQRSVTGEDGDDYSTDTKSPMPQQPDRTSSVSPAVGLNGAPGLQRQSSDFNYMSVINGGMAVPAHMRSEIQPSPRAQSPVQYPVTVNGQSQRPTLTSNPSSGYNQPQILEPPTNGQQQTNSGSNSPHAQSLGWQSPHTALSSHQGSDFSYPDPNNSYQVNPSQMYYQQHGAQRPHSTGPLDYHNHLRGQEMWAHHQQ